MQLSQQDNYDARSAREFNIWCKLFFWKPPFYPVAAWFELLSADCTVASVKVDLLHMLLVE